MKNGILAILSVSMLFFLEYGLASGIGGKISSITLILDILILVTFFYGKEAGYLFTLFGGLLSEIISPYRFGSVTLALFFTLLVTSFLSTRVFTNRALYSYTLISFFAFSAYFLFLFLAGLLDLVIGNKIMIFPLEFSYDNISGVFLLNLAFLSILFLITNSLTKKMHAAFITGEYPAARPRV